MRERIVSILAVLAVALGVALAGAPQTAAQTNPFYRETTLSAAAVLTADTNATGVRGFARATLAGFQQICTEDSGTATLDTAIQRSIDGGTTWVTIVSFTQLSAGGTEVKLYADVRTASPQMIGDRLRVSYDITGTGQYTCTVKAAFEN